MSKWSRFNDEDLTPEVAFDFVEMLLEAILEKDPSMADYLGGALEMLPTLERVAEGHLPLSEKLHLLFGGEEFSPKRAFDMAIQVTRYVRDLYDDIGEEALQRYFEERAKDLQWVYDTAFDVAVRKQEEEGLL